MGGFRVRAQATYTITISCIPPFPCASVFLVSAKEEEKRAAARMTPGRQGRLLHAPMTTDEEIIIEVVAYCLCELAHAGVRAMREHSRQQAAKLEATVPSSPTQTCVTDVSKRESTDSVNEDWFSASGGRFDAGLQQKVKRQEEVLRQSRDALATVREQERRLHTERMKKREQQVAEYLGRQTRHVTMLESRIRVLNEETRRLKHQLETQAHTQPAEQSKKHQQQTTRNPFWRSAFSFKS